MSASALNDWAKITDAVSSVLVHPLEASVKLFRTLNKDQQGLLISLLSLAGLAYTSHYFSNCHGRFSHR
jgi:hypothetical protein